MNITAPNKINDVGVEIPASKSISNRLLIIQALSKSGEIQNLSEAEDTLVLKQMLSEMPETMNVGHAGTAFRFLTAFLSIGDGTHVLTGSERMKNRPIAPLVNALRALGANIQYLENEGFPPLKIQGKKLQGGAVTVDSSISSQFISALMLIGPSLENGLRITLSGDVVSRSYIDMTAKLMSSCGAQINVTGNTIGVSTSTYYFEVHKVEKDWSAIAFWYSFVRIGKIDHLLLKNVPQQSIQGDAYVRELFMHLGVKSRFDAEGLHLAYDGEIETTLPRILDFSKTPDLAQPFVVTLAVINGQYVLSGTSTLQHKETNRGLALKTELAKMGGFIDVAPDSILVLKGVNETQSATVEIATYQDHRMAMAFAPLAMKYEEIKIQNTEVVKKSYPLFWDQLAKLGFTLVKIN